MTGAAATIGVAGAGTMGAGIAQLGCLSGARTLLHDPDAAALERGLEGIKGRLKRAVERGRLSESEAEEATRSSSTEAVSPWVSLTSTASGLLTNCRARNWTSSFMAGSVEAGSGGLGAGRR